MTDKPVTTPDEEETIPQMCSRAFAMSDDPDEKIWWRVIEEVGIWPASVQGSGEDNYSQRDQFKEGWNAAMMKAANLTVKYLKEAKDAKS